MQCMRNSEQAVSIIQHYIQEYLPPPARSWDKQEFKKRSYQLWAAYEICNRIMDNPCKSPFRAIDGFVFEMAIYTDTDDPTARFIFTNALETAKEITLLLV